jgi:hypothetical protein
MKNWTLILYIALISLCACSRNRKEIKLGTISDSGAKVISLNPDKENKIYLSEVAQSINVKILETTDESLIGDILAIEYDGDYFIHNNIDKFVYVFDSIGNFKRQIGKKGNGPGEIIYPECFSLDKERKEVLLTNNFQSINKYNYNGQFVGKEDIDTKFRKFFILGGTYYFHTSKLHNFDNKGNSICANLWISDEEGYKLFFPYDPAVYPNGGLYFDTAIPFSETSRGIIYNYVFCDTIYSLEKKEVKPIYIINYEKNGTTKNLNTIPGEDVEKYLEENPDKAYYVQNVFETDNFLRLNYLMGFQIYEVFYEKNSNNLIEGVLINDLLGGYIDFKTHINNKLIGYIQSSNLDIKEKASDFFDEATMKKLQSIDKDDNNPIFVELELKPLQ